MYQGYSCCIKWIYLLGKPIPHPQFTAHPYCLGGYSVESYENHQLIGKKTVNHFPSYDKIDTINAQPAYLIKAYFDLMTEDKPCRIPS